MFDWSTSWQKRTHRGLRHWVLYLVRDSPMNGAEIMDGMEGMSRGMWRPSPGSVYPLLESMVKEGVVKQLDDKKYEITDSGREELDWPRRMRPNEPRSVEEVLRQVSGYVSYLEDISRTDAAKVKENAAEVKTLAERLRNLGGQ